jgi:hypothetical protein
VVLDRPLPPGFTLEFELKIGASNMMTAWSWRCRSRRAVG